jgi:hypothetical protein
MNIKTTLAKVFSKALSLAWLVNIFKIFKKRTKVEEAYDNTSEENILKDYAIEKNLLNSYRWGKKYGKSVMSWNYVKSYKECIKDIKEDIKDNEISRKSSVWTRVNK